MGSPVVARAKPHQIIQISPFQPPAIAQMMSVEMVSSLAAAGCLAHPPSAMPYCSADSFPVRRAQIDVPVEPAAARAKKSDYQDCKDQYHKHHNYSTTDHCSCPIKRVGQHLIECAGRPAALLSTASRPRPDPAHGLVLDLARVQGRYLSQRGKAGI